MKKKIKISALLLLLVLSSTQLVHAGNFLNVEPQLTINRGGQSYVTRGEAVHKMVESFDLADKNAKFITDCMSHLDECFFVFTAMTRFDGVTLDPLHLYPDVSPAYNYEKDIHLATMLGLVHGNIDIKGSPFYPRAYLTRIQALKILLGAGDLMAWREKFEIVRDLGNEDALRAQTSLFKDVNALREDSWWYPRYVNFALDKGVIDAGEYFRPDEPITLTEYDNMLQRALKESKISHAAQNSQTQPSGNSVQ